MSDKKKLRKALQDAKNEAHAAQVDFLTATPRGKTRGHLKGEERMAQIKSRAAQKLVKRIQKKLDSQSTDSNQ